MSQVSLSTMFAFRSVRSPKVSSTQVADYDIAQASRNDLSTNPPCHSRAVSQVSSNVIYRPGLTYRSVQSKVTESFPCFPILWLIVIQDCLAKNTYNEEKCRSQVDALYDCCNEFYRRFGDNAKSASCPKAGLLRLKLKQRAEESGSNSTA